MSFLSRKLINSNKIPKHKIELHLHLEGAVRLTTIWEFSHKKDIKLTPNGTLDELRDRYLMKKPETLVYLLDIIDDYMKVFHGDSNALERIAYELCEDEAKEGVLYFEVRMSPQLNSNTVKQNNRIQVSFNDPNACPPKQVVESVLKGLKRGQKDFGVQCSLILSCITKYPEWSEETLLLAQEFQGSGVVGIDIAGPERRSGPSTHSFTETEIKTFLRAKEMNIHRTCHAGEVGPAANVDFAVQHLGAERIGHGYSVVQDQDIYKKCLSANIHFECCPISSYFTGAVNPSDKHPIIQLAEDGANFSIGKDDPTSLASTLDSEYEYLRGMGLTELHFIRANINAAKSSFLPSDAKNELLNQLYAIYNIN